MTSAVTVPLIDVHLYLNLPVETIKYVNNEFPMISCFGRILVKELRFLHHIKNHQQGARKGW